MTNAVQELTKMVNDTARNTTVIVSLNILQDVLSELREAKAKLQWFEANQPMSSLREDIESMPRLNLVPVD